MKLFGLMMLVLAASGVLAAEPVLKYDFTGELVKVSGNYEKPQYSGATVMASTGKGNALELDGKKFFLTVPKSENLHLTEGGTLLSTVKFIDQGEESGKDNAHDMIFFKPDEFLLGRSGGQLYFNMKCGGQWTPMASVASGVTGRWILVAATVEKQEKSYEVKIYLDGKMIFAKKYHGVTPDQTNLPVTIGKGWGGPWFLKGELAEVAVFKHPLGAEAIAALAKANPLIQQ